MVRGPAAILTILVTKSVLQTCFRWTPCVVLRFLLSKTTMSVKLMMHFWWNLKVSVFWTAVQPPRSVALWALKPCSPRVTNMILEFQRLIRLGGRPFNFGDGASGKVTSLSRLSQSEMMLLVLLDPCAFVLGSAETDTVDAGYEFSQGTPLRHRLWQRLDSFPNAV